MVSLMPVPLVKALEAVFKGCVPVVKPLAVSEQRSRCRDSGARRYWKAVPVVSELAVMKSAAVAVAVVEGFHVNNL